MKSSLGGTGSHPQEGITKGRPGKREVNDFLWISLTCLKALVTFLVIVKDQYSHLVYSKI